MWRGHCVLTTMKNRTLILSFSLAGALAASAASFSVDFTAAEGFTTGPADGQMGGTPSVGVVAQSGVDIDTTTGLLTSATNGFLRSIYDAGGTAAGDFTTGSTLTATGLTFNRGSFDGPLAVFGLTSGTVAGAAQNEFGFQLRTTGTDIFLDGQAFGPVAPVDTGFNIGDTFDATISFLDNGDGTFDAISTVGTASFVTADNVTLPAASGLIFQAQGGVGGTLSIDSLALTTEPVPEPSSALLLGLGGVALLRRRR